MKQRPPKRMKPNLFYIALSMDEAFQFLAWRTHKEMEKAIDDSFASSFGRSVTLSKRGRSVKISKRGAK